MHESFKQNIFVVITDEHIKRLIIDNRLMMNILKEWDIKAPWGQIALISWGNPAGSPVLLVHGRQDSAATFQPLLQLMSDDHHYVALDLPGHGKSEAFPKGVILMRFHFVAAVDFVVRYLQWTQYAYVGHSMGAEIGLFYNAVYPGRIKKFVLLDVGPSLQRLYVEDYQEYFQSFHQKYYDNYTQYNQDDRVYTKQKALEAVIRARGLTRSQAELVLSRNLTAKGDHLYTLSWDRRLKLLAPWPLSFDTLYKMFSFSLPTTLCIVATDSIGHPKGEKPVKTLLSRLERDKECFHVVQVKGGHDVHLTNPERLVAKVDMFLKDNLVSGKSKL